jgi:hypothetical protein
MTYRAPLAGWCVGYGNHRTPHYVDLLIRSNAPHDLCQACHQAWSRDDPKGTR